MFQLPQKKMLLDGVATAIADAFATSKEEEIADENLEYEKERNAIEDARYEEETAYNRQFAEDERSYNRAFAEDERRYQREFAENQREYERALQQQIFEREDTAIDRQVNSLSKFGINPLSHQLGGLDSGAPVSAGSAPSSSIPSASAGASSSTRGGKALHNDYKPSSAFANMMTPMLSLANALNNISTGGFQRDKLREEADYQRLKNQEQEIINERLANKLDSEQEAREEENKFNKENNPNKIKNEKATAERNQRENEFQETYGVQDGSDRIVRIATDTANQAQRATNYVEDKVGDLSKSATKSMVDNTRKAFKAYDRATRKIQDGIVNGFKKFGRKVNEFGNKYLGANY